MHKIFMPSTARYPWLKQGLAAEEAQYAPPIFDEITWKNTAERRGRELDAFSFR
ncbi:MAG: hypothetical protein H0X43_02890 [Nitrosospira sp.]|nr:hypothetical protein [Nitrosospira sp.]